MEKAEAVRGRRGRHVAVFNVPLHGHVIPTPAPVQELVARGHRVSYAVTEEFAAQVRAAGATPVLYEVPPRGRRARTWRRAWRA